MNKNIIGNKKNVFWDFDGVIKDSVEIKSNAYEELFTKWGNEVANRVRGHHNLNGGMSRFDKIPLYLKWAGEEVTEELVAKFCNLFSENVMQSVIDSPWVPGVKEWLLDNFQKKQFILVTATPQHEIEKILLALNINQCFQGVFGSPIIKKEAIRLVLEKENISPYKALMIGDSETDLLAANDNAVNFLLRRTNLNLALQASYKGLQFEYLNYEQN